MMKKLKRAHTRASAQCLSNPNAPPYMQPPDEIAPYDDGNRDIPIRIIRNARQRVIPRRKRRQQTKEASRLDDRGIGLARRVPMQVSDAEEQKGEVEGEEEGKKGDGGAEGAEEDDGGEDEPALRLRWLVDDIRRVEWRNEGSVGMYHEEESERV